jgi:hypothetical protein
MGLEELVGGRPVEVDHAEPTAARARVLKLPPTPEGVMTVALDDFTAALEYEIPAVQRVGMPTAVGERLLVLTDDQGDSWSVSGGAAIGTGAGGGTQVYVQLTEPEGAAVGSIWIQM